MKTIAKVAGAVLFGILLTGAVRADENSVSVIGKGEIKVKPDVAFVTLLVKADALTMADAAKQAGEKVDEVKKALKIYKEIRSINVSDAAIGELQKRSFSSSDEKDEAQHPEVVRRLLITMKPDAVKVFAVVDTAISAGAIMQMSSPISYNPYEEKTIVVYGVSKPAEAESQARQAALADAKKQAEALASMAGKKVGGVMKISTDASAESKFILRLVDRQADFPTPYTGHSSEEVAVGSVLTVVFELQSK